MKKFQEGKKFEQGKGWEVEEVDSQYKKKK